MSLAVIIAARNAEPTLARCLGALRAAEDVDFDLIVVDDASDDQTALIASERGATVIVNTERQGTSPSRNRGAAAATADILVFVDSDVVVAPDTLRRVADNFERIPGLIGVNGIFSADHDAPGAVSHFVHLSIRHQHLRLPSYTGTCFTSIFAIRRDVFEAIGGFEEHLDRPYGDDVQMRFKLTNRSARVYQDHKLTVGHLKVVDLPGLCRSRFFIGRYFIPLLLGNKDSAAADPRTRTQDPRYPFNVLLVATGLFATWFALLHPPMRSAWPWMIAALAPTFFWNNGSLFSLIAKKRGWFEAALAVPLTLLESMLYLTGMTYGVLVHAWQKAFKRQVAGRETA
ncbi:MAG: glycosyltransferase family 2 protein [Deltaproteobacteria bacterium]|nr:glycosyltransferase family 2 protein [Deltaproteobacteria bacterium]